MAGTPETLSTPTGTAGRRSLVAIGAFILWTLFVWVGRIRNAVSDEALDDGGRTGPLLLSISFVVPALVLAVLLVVAGRAHTSLGPAGSWLLRGLAGWTTAVWLIRAGDIVLTSDRGAAFVTVHLVLAAVSIGLAAWAVTTDLRAPGRPPAGALGVSRTTP